MVDQLFGSKTRVKLLQLFYSNPNRSFYVREITRKIDEQINSVRRELANLLNIGIITSDTNNNRLYYEVNQDYEYYKPLGMIFSSASTVATARKPAASATATAPKESAGVGALDLKKLGNVELLLYTGQFTRDESAGIDLLIVGDVNPTKLNKFIEALEHEENKELRYTLMNPSEFRYRQQIKDRFLSNVLASKSHVVIDKSGLAKGA
jgi:hypothetical protein